MRRIDEAVQSFRKPVIAPGLLAIAVHALLDDNPFAVIGDDEAVQIEIEPILHRGAVDLRDQAAGLGQRAAVEPDALADRNEFMPASAANACRVRRRRGRQVRHPSGVRPRFSAPITLVVMPEECQSIPMTAPNDWNQKGWARRRRSSSRP